MIILVRRGRLELPNIGSMRAPMVSWSGSGAEKGLRGLWRRTYISALVPPEGAEYLDAARASQHALYRTVKADPGRRFHALYDKVHRRDVLQRAWGQVRRDNGAPGIDQTTLAEVEEYGVARLLDELEAELKVGAYRPLPARRVLIPKLGADERRPLSIPSVRDRVVQAALKLVLEPIFEADFLPCLLRVPADAASTRRDR